MSGDVELYRGEWVADDSWKLDGEGRRCRMRGCQNQAVAAFKRKRGRGFEWWHYCESHLYGRKIEDGVVKFHRLVKVESA